MIWGVALVSIFSLLASGVWIGVTLGITGIIIMMIWGAGVPLLGGKCWSALNVYGLTAVPGFLFMGQVVLRSGLAARIYDTVSPFLARFPGKLLHSNVVVSGMFAAVFGSSTACAATVGSVAIPELRKRKYDERLVLGSICVAGTLGLMIPPSGQFILYGSVANVSVGALFAAGMIPGIMMVVLYMIYIGIKGTISPQIAPPEKVVPLKDALRPIIGLWPLIILMIACIGPIYSGLATPTESAGIGAFASIIIGSTLGTLRWKTLWECIKETAKITSLLFFIFLGAMILATALSTLGLPRQLVNWVGTLPVSPTVILIFIYIMYIILGCFLDGISMMLMTLPFVSPIITNIGFDALWFGVLLVLVIEIGQVTPPLGVNLFVVQGIAGPRTSISDVFFGSIPFLLCTLVVLGIITVAPGIVSWFPNLLGL